MSVTLIVNNIPFDYPEQGEQAPWGEAATGWAQEVTTVINSIYGPYDILESSANILNNTASFTDIFGLSFDSNFVRSFEIDGNVYRTTGVVEKTECFKILGDYTGSDWQITIEGIGDSGTSFNITPAGQLQYDTDNLAGQTSGLIKFKAQAIRKT